ncbi:hypothetical protein [Aphanizomenon sp. UHCC 0183]|uniref:hypothetical protein n=1 Tax=Aphanizomenon sp. UHCC 0183 TaxID=2590028 RepID=UPI0014471D17|nr:hypothetical protein [Aphanizomenon sp. UHCC 0183]MTJ32921.1 hypothetical protein [Aphanizomenon sp. UHCC 0183]
MNAQAQNLQTLYAKTRLLLALWDLGGSQQKVARSKLRERIVSKGQKMADYQGILEDLEAQGAVTVTKKGSAISYTLISPTGLDVLKAGLRSDEFQFNTNLGAWVGNSLLRLLRQVDVVVAAPIASGGAVIGSYEEFKSVALAVYDKLNKDYNLDDLVPIYRIRREIGEQVSREKFNKWLLEMQEKDILQLQGGSLPDNDPVKLEDSVITEVSGLRCYAKRLI